MAITTHAELKTAIANYLNRSDLTTYIPDFITLGNQRINYGADLPYPSQPLRIPAMQASATGTITSSSISFPTRFLEPIRLVGRDGSTYWNIDYVSPTVFTEKENGTDIPSYYTYLGNAIKTAGTGAADYTLDYYQAFAALSADADTNWILANAPGIYLYAALLESAPFLGADERIPFWHSLLKAAISAVNKSTQMQGSGLSVRLS